MKKSNIVNLTAITISSYAHNMELTKELGKAHAVFMVSSIKDECPTNFTYVKIGSVDRSHDGVILRPIQPQATRCHFIERENLPGCLKGIEKNLWRSISDVRNHDIVIENNNIYKVTLKEYEAV